MTAKFFQFTGDELSFLFHAVESAIQNYEDVPDTLYSKLRHGGYADAYDLSADG